MDNKILTVETLKKMTGDIADVLLKRAENQHEKVELHVTATSLDGGVSVQIEATTATGQVLFAVQADLYGRWLETATELNLRSVVFKGNET